MVILMSQQHSWSFAGNNDRKSTNHTNIQYFIWRMLPGEWQIGTSPYITMNWEADRDNRFTVPVGLGVEKLVKLGKLLVKIQLQGRIVSSTRMTMASIGISSCR